MELVLGTAQLARRYGVLDRRSEADARASASTILEEAWRSGTRIIDTAPTYGLAEELLGQSGLGFEVHTKLDPSLCPRKSLERSADALLTSAISVVYFHERYEGTTEQLDFLEWVPRSSFQSVEVGVSIYSEDEFWQALERPEIAVIQIPLSFLDQRFGKSLQEEGVSRGKKLFARSIFHQGLLAREDADLSFLDESAAMAITQFRHVARAHSLSPAQAAMSWVCNHDLLSGIVVGAASAAEWRDSVKMFSKIQGSFALGELEEVPLPGWNLIDPRQWGDLKLN